MYLALVTNGTSKPSTLMRWCGILLLLILSIHMSDSPSRGGYMCEAKYTVWGIPDSVVPRTVSFDPKLKTFGNCLVVV
jgi:hypothetical protein